MVLDVPIADEEGDVTIGLGEGHRDYVAAVDDDAAVTAGGALEAERGEVEEAADLVLHLEVVSPVPARRDWAVGAQDPVIPTVLPHLYPIPGHQDSH